MFQSLRPGMPVYVLQKGNEPTLEVCEVVSRTEPVLPTGINTNFVAGQQFLAPPKKIVDVRIQRHNGDFITYQQLPAEADIADIGTTGTVLSTSSNAIQNEIEMLRKHSMRVLDSVEQHKKTVAMCDKMLAELNPSLKEREKQSEDIETLRGEVNELRGDLIDIKGMLSKALNVRKNKED